MTNTKNKRVLKTGIAATTIALIGAFGLTAGAEAFGGKGGEGRGGHGRMGGMGQQMMQGMDQDSDGTVTEAEVEAHLLNMFATVDANSDGAVTLDEMKAARDAHRAANAAERPEGRKGAGERSEKHGKRNAERGEGRGGKHGQRGDRGERGIERMFQRADADDNGNVSEEEFKTAISTYTDNIAERANRAVERQAARFSALDTNGDGQISPEEFQAGRDGKRGGKR